MVVACVNRHDHTHSHTHTQKKKHLSQVGQVACTRHIDNRRVSWVQFTMANFCLEIIYVNSDFKVTAVLENGHGISFSDLKKKKKSASITHMDIADGRFL